jgi:hypothetical protein
MKDGDFENSDESSRGVTILGLAFIEAISFRHWELTNKITKTSCRNIVSLLLDLLEMCPNKRSDKYKVVVSEVS